MSFSVNQMKTLYAFRHGETDWNRARRLQGSTDIPLNEKGREQALRLRDFFKEKPVEVFLSSDLVRAVETARIAAGDSGVSIVTDRRLRESDLGEAEGLTLDEALVAFGADVWEDWYGIAPNKWHVSFPGGETKAQHLARMLEGIQEFLQTTSARHIGLATHGGSLRRLIHHLRPDLVAPITIGNCALYELTFDPASGLWSVDLEMKCSG